MAVVREPPRRGQRGGVVSGGGAAPSAESSDRSGSGRGASSSASQEYAFTEAGCALLLLQTHRHIERLADVVVRSAASTGRPVAPVPTTVQGVRRPLARSYRCDQFGRPPPRRRQNYAQRAVAAYLDDDPADFSLFAGVAVELLVKWRLATGNPTFIAPQKPFQSAVDLLRHADDIEQLPDMVGVPLVGVPLRRLRLPVMRSAARKPGGDGTRWPRGGPRDGLRGGRQRNNS